jgi:acyl dehydratase
MSKLVPVDSLQSIAIDDVSSWIGKEIGPTDWLQISQERINQFAVCTNDEQWIHTDPARATKESPFGTTIGHGFLTLSLLSHFVHECLQISDATVAINYGLNRVRFPHPVKVDSRLRARITIQACEAIDSGIQYTLSVNIEIAGISKPACVAEPIFRALR